MLTLDHKVVCFFNGFVNRSWTVDELVWLMAVNALPKLVLGIMFWWAWFGSPSNRTKNRQALISAIVGSFLGVLAIRIISSLLPFRPRPLHEPILHLVWPQVVPAGTLISWSAFPSGHATMLFGLAAGLFFVSFSAGVVALAWVAGISFGRIYLGFHYPSDILGGGVIGVAMTLLANIPTIRSAMAEPVLRWEAKYPAYVYPSIFMLLVLVGTAFGPVIEIGQFGIAVSHHALAHLRLVH